MPDWTKELKASVVEKYLAENPTPETSTEIVKKLAEALGEGFTANGVRVILVKTEIDGKSVYVKKGETTTKSNGTKSVRVNKVNAVKELTEIIESAGLEVDIDIISKMTGKAAVYFKNVIEKIIETEEEAIQED